MKLNGLLHAIKNKCHQIFLEKNNAYFPLLKKRVLKGLGLLDTYEFKPTAAQGFLFEQTHGGKIPKIVCLRLKTHAQFVSKSLSQVKVVNNL